jgi:hypothetical protein
MNKEGFDISTTSFIELCEEYGDFTAGVIQLIKEMEKGGIITVHEPQSLVGLIANHLVITSTVHFKSYTKGGEVMYDILNEMKDDKDVSGNAS